MILEYLERMREKPHAVRRRFAFLCASGVTLAITLVWGMSLPSQLAALSLSNVDLPEEVVGTDTLGESISEENANLKESLGTSAEVEQAFSVFSEGGMYGGNATASDTQEKPPTEAEAVRMETVTAPTVLIATTSGDKRD